MAAAQPKKAPPTRLTPKAKGPAPVPNLAGGPADPAVVVQGLAVLGIYALVRRSFKPLAWLAKQLRSAVFDWKDYNKYLREQSVVEGVFQGRKAWLALGAIIWGIRAFRKATTRTEQIVLNEVLLPGDQIFIRQIPKKIPRRQRKAG